MKKTILIALILAAGFAAADAQSASSASQTVGLTLQNAISTSIGTASGTNFIFANSNDYQNGLTNSNASTFQVKSNRPWEVTVNTATANFSGPAAHHL